MAIALCPRACVCMCGAYPKSGTSTATAAGNLEETLIAQRQHLTVTARHYRIAANTAHALLLCNIYHDVSRLRTTRTKVINVKLFIRTIVIVRRQFTINHTLLQKTPMHGKAVQFLPSDSLPSYITVTKTRRVYFRCIHSFVLLTFI